MDRVRGDRDDVLSQIPAGLFVMTAAHDECRSGALVRWVQQCAETPAMVAVAMRKGQPIEPLIRDSRTFALCQLLPEDVFLRRKFELPHCHGEDPFISLPTAAAPGGSPILLGARSCIECELARHLDIESDFELYIGLVRHAAMLSSPTADLGRLSRVRSRAAAPPAGPPSAIRRPA